MTSYHTHGSRGGRFSPAFVCLSLFSSSRYFKWLENRYMQLGSPNLTQTCSTMSPGNSFILESKGHRSRQQAIKTALTWDFLHSCECRRFSSRRTSAGMFERAMKSCRCLSVTLNVALKRGSSKFGKALRASLGWNFVVANQLRTQRNRTNKWRIYWYGMLQPSWKFNGETEKLFIFKSHAQEIYTEKYGIWILERRKDAVFVKY